MLSQVSLVSYTQKLILGHYKHLEIPERTSLSLSPVFSLHLHLIILNLHTFLPSSHQASDQLNTAVLDSRWEIVGQHLQANALTSNPL